MMTNSGTSDLSQQVSAQNTDLKWRCVSMLSAWFWAVFNPLRMIRQHGEVTTAGQMLQAWMVHLAGLASLACFLLALDCIYYLAFGTRRTALLYVPDYGLQRDVLMIVGMDLQAWLNWIEPVLIGLAVLEVSLAVTSVFLVSWTAGLEPFVSAFLRTLKRMWLLTPMLTLPLVAWYQFYMLAYAVLVGSTLWRFEFSAWGGATLFFSRVIGLGCLAVWMWLLRRGGRGASCHWPPSCEVCGYKLYIQEAAGASCPECGEAVASSLHNRSARCKSLGVGFRLSPVSLGRSLPMRQGYIKPRLLFMLSILTTVLIASLGGTVTVLYVSYVQDFIFRENMLWALALLQLLAVIYAVVLAALAIAMASLSGFFNRSVEGFASHPAACGAMGHFSVYLPLLPFVQWMILLPAIIAYNLNPNIARWIDSYSNQQFVTAFLILVFIVIPLAG